MTTHVNDHPDQVAWHRERAIQEATAKAKAKVPMDAASFADFIAEYVADLIAIERRATVERIRERIENLTPLEIPNVTPMVEWHDVVAILDEEDQRE